MSLGDGVFAIRKISDQAALDREQGQVDRIG